MPDAMTMKEVKACLTCLKSLLYVGRDGETKRSCGGEAISPCCHQKLCNALKVEIDRVLAKEREYSGAVGG